MRKEIIKIIDSKIYKVGIYLRLSREDKKGEEGNENNRPESLSIENQRNILEQYVKDNNLIYVDEMLKIKAYNNIFRYK